MNSILSGCRRRNSLSLIIVAVAIGVGIRSVAQNSDSGSGINSSASAARPGNERLNFQADLFTGRFAYSVPIVIAPARQGAQPALALAYNSAGGNGWCGVGWSLEAGFIQRETRYGVPLKWGTTVPLNEYDDAKGFVFNVGGASGTLVNVGGNEYRAEVDGAFLRFLYFKGQNYWEVTDKSGNKFYFGETNDPFGRPTNSRMENDRPGWTPGVGQSTFRWSLNRVRDVNGNETYLSYMNEGNELYITAIRYNANVNVPALPATHTVEFQLEDRNDRSFSFQAGYRVAQNKRLSQIQVRVSGDPVRRYALGYTYSPSTGRSLLTGVTEFGADDISSLPPTTFDYQVKPTGFETGQTWGPVGTPNWTATDGSLTAQNTTSYVDLIDVNSDGLADRASLREEWQSTEASCGSSFDPQDVLEKHYFWDFQLNTAQGFTTNTPLGEIPSSQWYHISATGCHVSAGYYPRFQYTYNGATLSTLADINGDGRLDRITRRDINFDQYSPNDYLLVQLNTGWGFGGFVGWTNASAQGSTSYGWGSIRYSAASGQGSYTVVDLVDMNGDGLPDRLMRTMNGPYDKLKVQFNTGAGFGPVFDWGTLLGGDGSSTWNSISSVWADSSDTSHTFVALADLNGDGLPDRILRKWSAPYDSWVVQFNNGAGFEYSETWGPVSGQGYEAGYAYWGAPEGTSQGAKFAILQDINGDGLPDRIMTKSSPPYTDFVVQLNTGSGFSPTNVAWGPLTGGDGSFGWSSPVSTSQDATYSRLQDINGDGLPDRLMRSYSAPYTNFVVQLNKGPFPDLLATISNNIGGRVTVTYAPSTSFDNRDQNGISQLPFPVYVVTSVVKDDGLGNQFTNYYSYAGGMFDGKRREFRGFNCVETADPLGKKMRTYFHQGGGRDDSANGEYEDQDSVAKKGVPYRIETWGSDGRLYGVTLNKVEEAMLHTNGWCFPYISQTVQLEYDGADNYRATAQQFFYDVNTGNLMSETNFGEVANVVFSTHAFNDVGSDSLYTFMTYATLSNADIINKPASIKITSDAAGNSKLRETKFFYAGARGNLTSKQVWLSPGNYYITASTIKYDQYGNPVTVRDAANITTTNFYDSFYQTFLVTNVTAAFTNQFVYDVRSGAAVSSTDVKGLVTSNILDVFYRPKETWISTAPYGPTTLWREKVDYSLGGVGDGASANYVRTRINNGVDAINGHETYTYADGLGRPIQTRVEAENGQYRVIDTLYDDRGNVNYRTLPYFSAGTGFSVLTGSHLGPLAEFDPIGRAVRTTPGYQIVFDASGQIVSQGPTGGDSGSPLASGTIAYGDGNNPWATVSTDAEGKVKKSCHDAYGRVTQVVEVTSGGDFNTFYGYDLVGNLTKVTNHTGQVVTMSYDSLGRKISMSDPDMGSWTYKYDNAGRLIEQLDAKQNWTRFFYSDALGRLTTKKIYDPAAYWNYQYYGYDYPVATIAYTHDSSGSDTAYSVYKGQVYKILDREGWQKFSYDVRGRVIKSTRYLNATATMYTTETTYDDADRISELTYPDGTLTKLRYSYDNAGNLTNVISLAGTGTPETFYSGPVFNALGQVTSVRYGNAGASQQIETYNYFINSARLQRMQTTLQGGGSQQDLKYTYDRVTNVKSISDRVWSGSSSSSITNVAYDDLHRLTSLTREGVTREFGYNAIGNVLTNGEHNIADYQYHATQVHAVISAGGKSYAYDACGNMTARGDQTLYYDEENRLRQVSGGDATVTFGYADDGTRLWRLKSGGTRTVWIGNILEIKDGKTLCHVFANGRRIASFEPQGGGPWAFSPVPQHDRFGRFCRAVPRALEWPLQDGRTPVTVLIVSLTGILCASLGGRGRSDIRFARFPNLRPVPFWRQAVSVWLIAGLVLSTGNTNVQAQPYNPVFYYCHNDHLGSSNIVLDRNGVRVQHCEYTAFGKDRFAETTPAFSLSNRYTGQVLDEDTGLYFYQSRYYDPEIGRFTQPDSVVPSPNNPQTLNRYTYVNNNPLKYVDPTGHIFGIDDLIIAIVIGAALGAATSAATGGDIGKGALTGAIGGIFGGLGGALGGALGGPVAALAGAVAGGATGGAVSAAVTGGDVGMGALTGAIAGGVGWGVGWFNHEVLKDSLNDFSVSVIGGSLGGGAGAELQGGDFWEGAAYGAAGAAAAHGLYTAIRAPWTGIKSAIRSQADSDRAAAEMDGLDLQINDWKYGHASNLSAAQRVLGILAAPLIAAYGIGYEAFHFFFEGHTEYRTVYQSITAERHWPVYSFFDGQFPTNWLWDTPGDIMANVVGQFSGLFLSPAAAAQFNRVVFLIPGPNYTAGPQSWTKPAAPGATWPW